MTINKSQSQSLNYVGVYLPQYVFSHGQLYVAVSRVTPRESLKILIVDNEGEDTNITSNIVYKEVFQRIMWLGIYIATFIFYYMLLFFIFFIWLNTYIVKKYQAC